MPAAVVTLSMNDISATSPPKYFCVNQSAPITYTFPNFDTIEVGLSQPVSVFPLPEAEEGAQEAIIVKVEGNSQTVKLTWTIKDEGTTDTSGGTITSPVSTQFEQLEFWTTTFENRSISQNYTFTICTGVPAEKYEKVVLLRDFRANISANAPVTWNASIDMIVGATVRTIDEVS